VNGLRLNWLDRWLQSPIETFCSDHAWGRQPVPGNEDINQGEELPVSETGTQDAIGIEVATWRAASIQFPAFDRSDRFQSRKSSHVCQGGELPVLHGAPQPRQRDVRALEGSKTLSFTLPDDRIADQTARMKGYLLNRSSQC
jgi:hypothetical protein